MTAEGAGRDGGLHGLDDNKVWVVARVMVSAAPLGCLFLHEIRQHQHPLTHGVPGIRPAEAVIHQILQRAPDGARRRPVRRRMRIVTHHAAIGAKHHPR